MPELGFGVHLISRGEGDPATTPFPSHKVMLEDGIRVEKLGFDAVWLPDHYYFDRPAGLETFPDVWTLLTAIAVKTEKVKLGTNVLAATFRHPALMAKMAGALQELSDGRVIVGLGAGNQINEHTAFGLDFPHRIGRFKEYLPIMCGLLNGETVTLDGKYFQVKDASLRTVMPQTPLWIASGGPQMFALTVKYATGWNMAGGGTDPAAIKEKYEGFAAACTAGGKNAKDFDVCKMSFVAVAPDAAAAKSMREELLTTQNLTPEMLASRMLVDTPDGIAARLREFTEIGINHHIFSVAPTSQFPNYWDAFELITKDVMPRVRA
jgi:alkanesulfonate monooxygenase SsuD/methylene tetrahydromethanopterin reductase-like flavin-dependent oxidoreductase (luciferase family)